MLETFVLGAIQGIAEWLPVSSEGLIVLASLTLFEKTSLVEAIHLALFLHLGTALAAVVYLRYDVIRLFRSLVSYHEASHADRQLLRFLLFATLASAPLGLVLVGVLDGVEETFVQFTPYAVAGIGVLLLVTGVLQLRNARTGQRQLTEARDCDAAWAGLAQGAAALPGLSRSGLTVATLLWRGYDASAALRLSFLMSIPAVIGANVIVHLSDFSLGVNEIVALVTAFVFGLVTIDAMLRVAARLNFGYFVVGFGFLTLASAFF